MTLGGINTLQILDSCQIGALQFDETAVFKADESPSENYTTTYYYIAKNIGIVRKEIPSQSEVWNLVNYHIVQ